MKFRKLVLRNWKNFAKADVDIPDRLFLVGPNASGKSNFLDAFRFLRDLASPGGGFQEAVRRRGGMSALRCLAARRYPNVDILVEMEESDGGRWEYELAFNQDRHRGLRLNKEIVRHNAQLLLNRPSREDRADLERLTQTNLEQVNVNRDFRDVASFFASVRYLHIVPQLVREPDRSVGRSNDPFGGDFLEQVAKTPDKKQKARLRGIRDALRIAVPQLDKIELSRDAARGTPHLRGKYRHWRAEGAWQSEEQFSNGTLRLLGLLWAILEGEGPLLLEEPELSLHPEVVHYLPQMFARVQRKTGRQIFLSTHSPELLRDEGIGLDEVLLLRPKAEGTEVRPATSLDQARRLLEGGLSVADIVMPETKPENPEQLPLFVKD